MLTTPSTRRLLCVSDSGEFALEESTIGAHDRLGSRMSPAVMTAGYLTTLFQLNKLCSAEWQYECKS